MLLAEWALTTNYFDGAVLDGPVPRFFAANPTEARAALSADASKAYKDLQRIFSRLFITENIPASDAWNFVGNPRQFVCVQFRPVKPLTVPKFYPEVNMPQPNVTQLTRTNSRQKDFIYAYKKGPYAAPTHVPDPVVSGSRRLPSEPPSKRQRTTETVAIEESCPPSPGRICSIATYSRSSKFHPNPVASHSYSLSFFFGLNGAV